MTTTEVTTITPPDRNWAAAFPVAPYAAHRQGATLWRVAPRRGGDATLARLDLNQVGMAPRVAGEVMSGRATLLLEGRLIPARRGHEATLIATEIEGGTSDPW